MLYTAEPDDPVWNPEQNADDPMDPVCIPVDLIVLQITTTMRKLIVTFNVITFPGVA